MPIYEHALDFAGKSVEDWDPEKGITDPEGTIYRIRLEDDTAGARERWSVQFARFLDDPASSQVTGIVIGDWQQWSGSGEESSAPIVEALVAAHDRLPNLTAIFLGDIVLEESEISWINQSDVSPLFRAYPALEHFRVRGSDGLVLGRLHHTRLKSLIIESGGLPVEVVRDVAAAELPALEHLELWLGTENYGADAQIDDIAPLLFEDRFPSLRYLGLRDSEIADEIAFTIARAPILQRIKVLDLSLGTLSDLGAAALIESPAIANLERLDLHHHFCSDGVMSQLVQLGARLGIKVNVSQQQAADLWDGEEHRFVAVSE